MADIHALSFVEKVNDDDSVEVQENKYRKAIEEHPEYRDVYLHCLYFVYWHSEQYENALIAIQQALECIKDPHDYSEYYHCLANAFSDLYKFPEAIEAMLKSVELSPFKADSYYYLGDLYVQSGDYAKAVEAFVRMLFFPSEIGGQTTEDCFFEFMSYYYQDKYSTQYELEEKEKNALIIFTNLLETAATDAQRAYMHCVLSEYYMHMGYMQKAQEEVERAQKILPFDPIVIGMT